MKKSLRVMMTLVFTAVLFAALAITASAKNWYATESAGGVDRLYITAADTEPTDGKTWYSDVPSPYHGASVNAWILIPGSVTNPVEIVISGDVVCPDGDTLEYGIYIDDDNYKDVTITGNGTGKLTINLTGDTHTGSAAIYNYSLSYLTISDMADMTLTAAKSDSDKLYSCGIYSYSKLTITNSTIGDITAGNAYECYGIYSSVNTEITNSTIGDISTGDSESNNYAIYTNEDFTITDSTIGDISTGDAKDENAGIYCDGEFKITNSTIGNISAGYTNYVNFGIYCDGEFKITNSTIGDISTKDTDDENYGIYCDSDFEIKDSTIGDISTGDAKDENAGIYCDGKFTITDSTIGNISAGDVPESGYSYGIYVDYDAKSSAQAASADGAATYGYVGDDENGNVGFTITNSAIGDITAGNAYYSMGICSSYLTITDSTFVAAGSSGTETSYGIWTFFLTIGESNPNAKYALDVTATGHCAISLGFSFTDAEGTIKLAGESKETAVVYDDPGDFVDALYTAKYARIYINRVATPTITESDAGEGRKLVTITCATSGAQIYYRLDGGDVTSPAAGTLYTGPFEISEDAVISARAFKEGYAPSGTATLEVEFEKQDGGADPLQYLLLIISRPKYKVTVEGGVTASVKEGLSLSALYAGELVTLTVAPGEDGGYTPPTVTTTGGGKVYLTDLGGGVYTFKMPSRDVIVKP